MNHLFPYDNIIVAVLLFIVGFVFHWVGQLISVVNWQFASKIGLQETRMLKEYKVYEHATAISDSILAWIYGVAAIGLVIGVPWSYKLAFIPGSILVYHSLNFWFYTRNQRNDGHILHSNSLRIGWTVMNTLTGILSLIIAWNSTI